VSAPASKRTFATSTWPLSQALKSKLWPFCSKNVSGLEGGERARGCRERVGMKSTDCVTKK